MTGTPKGSEASAAAPSVVKRPVIVLGAALAIAFAAGLGVWFMRGVDMASPTPAPQAAPPAVASVTPVADPTPAATQAATPADTISIAEAPPPPPPASTEFTGSQQQPSAPAESTPSPGQATSQPTKPAEWEAMPIGELRARAETNQVPAMEELARRLLEGIGVTKDQQAGAGWLLRAAEAGSAKSAFNAGVMYERGFVVDRDSSRAVEWYRKAAEAGPPAAKHNLALLLRDGRGTPRNGKEAIELLRSAALQGMAASMFTLGDIYERGDAAPKDPAMALGWFAVTAEFDRQMNRDTDTPLSQAATQRVQTLQRLLTPAELERGQKLGQREFDQIVAALQPRSSTTPTIAPPARPNSSDSANWGKTVPEQVRAIQQLLADMGFLNEKPDGAIGPMTRNAIKAFQKSSGLRETGEPTRDVFTALRNAAKRDVVANSPLPLPPKSATPNGEPVATGNTAVTPPAAEPAKPDIAKLDPGPYPANFVDQVKAVQILLRALDLYTDEADGSLGPATRTAIRNFQKNVGMRETGEPTKDVYTALQEALQRASAGQPIDRSR